MSEINLDDAKINYEGEWLSAEDLANRIQTKMQSGELKFAGLAAALEELNKALENSQRLEINLVLTKEQYRKLQTFGGNDEREAVRKAILAVISPGANPAGAKEAKAGEPERKKGIIIKCPACKSPIKVETDERPTIVECSHCGISGRLTPENKWSKLDA